MRRDEGEIIEVFDTDATLFDHAVQPVEGPGDAADGWPAEGDANEHRRPRWVVPVGFAALAAVVVVSLTSGSSDSATTSASTQPASTDQSTLSTPITLAPLPTDPVTAADRDAGAGTDAPEYVVDFPATYAVVGADDFTITRGGPPRQLWAVPGSTATRGRWVEISASPAFGQRLDPTVDSYRIDVDGTLGFVTPGRSPQEATRLVMVRDNSVVSVEALGVSVEFLTAVAASVSITLGSPDISSSVGLFDDFRLVDDNDAGSWLFGEGNVVGLYAADSSAPTLGGRGAFLNINVGRAPAATDNYEARLPFIVDPIRVFRAPDGSLGVAGRLPNLAVSAPDNVSLAHWIDADGWLVAIVMTGTVDEVIGVAQTARRDAATWQRLAQAAQFVNDQAQEPDVGTQATITVSADYSDEAVLRELGSTSPEYVWQVSAGAPLFTSNSFPLFTRPFAADAPNISTAATNDSQVVLAAVPRDLVGATLTVRVGDEPAVTVALTDRDPGFAVLSAAVGTAAVGPMIAVITAADGTIVATWPAL